MKLSRRDLLAGVSAIAMAAGLSSPAKAILHRSPGAFTLSGRNIINLQQFSIGTTDYAFIDHIKSGVNSFSPGSSDWNPSGVPTFPSVIDANGYVNQTSGSGFKFGCGFYVPDTTNFAGPYTLDIIGSGVIDIIGQNPDNTAFTTASPVNCSVTFNGSGLLQVTSTATGVTRASIQVTLSFPTQVGPRVMQCFIVSTGSAGANFISSVRWYRTADATDLAAGKIFRAPWKQLLVNLDPSAIRWMNNLGGNQDQNCRFENRTLPTDAGYSNYSQWTKSPSYSTNVTGTNQFVCAAATPTTANPKNTAASMVHGEVATMRFTNGFTRSAGNGINVSAITNANPGVVATDSAHGFSTGDIISHYFEPMVGLQGTLNGTTTITNASGISSAQIGMFLFGSGIPANTTITNVVGSTVTISNAATISGTTQLAAFSMKNLHQYPVKITVTDATHYSLQTVGGANLDTTSFGTFVATPNGTQPYAFVSLQVGSGNDRTAYPMTILDGNTPANFFGDAYLRANDYKTCFFDKTVSAQTDGSGNPIMGCWIMDATAFQNVIGFSGDYPIEVCVALCNELNAMSPAHTIGLWMNIPIMGLSTMDPDYSSASNWATNAVDVVMNPSSSVRTNGFSALGYSGSTKLNSPVLVLEYSNEVWPSGTNNGGRGWLQNRTVQRWSNFVGGATAPAYAFGNDWGDLKGLRQVCWVRDVKATSPPNSSQIKYVMGMWGFTGFAPGNFGGNYETAFGGTVRAVPINEGDLYTNDTLVTGGSWGTPISNLDGVCPATYFDPPDTYYSTTTGTGTFTDDSAMFNGTNNSGNGGGNYTGAANPTQAITNFVAKVVDVANTGGGQSITAWTNTMLPQYVSNLPTGKVILGYEGATDWQTLAGGNQAGHVLTAGDQAFSIAVINSSQWATAQVNFFNTYNSLSKCFMPALYLWIQGAIGNQRWGYCTPDSYATITGTPTEGAALTVNSPVWIAMSSRNQGLSN